MLVIISPAKTLDFKTPPPTEQYSQPIFLHQAKTLVDLCRQLTPAKLASLMSISDKLAGLNAIRFAHWQGDTTIDHARQALFAFKGEVYQGLQSADFNQNDIAFAQHHLRILSGLYGILRPLDLIQPYRLEMSIKLQNDQGKDLYHFWQNKITDALNTLLAKQTQPLLINLASDEYFKAIMPGKINAKIIKPIFLDKKSGKYKTISFYAKKARGLMCRYIIKHQLTTEEQLTKFTIDGYQFCHQDSNDHQLIFKRDNE